MGSPQYSNILDSPGRPDYSFTDKKKLSRLKKRIEGGNYDLEELGKVELASFEIGKYPVTNAWCAEFIEAGGDSNKEYLKNMSRFFRQFIPFLTIGFFFVSYAFVARNHAYPFENRMRGGEQNLLRDRTFHLSP